MSALRPWQWLVPVSAGPATKSFAEAMPLPSASENDLLRAASASLWAPAIGFERLGELNQHQEAVSSSDLVVVLPGLRVTDPVLAGRNGAARKAFDVLEIDTDEDDMDGPQATTAPSATSSTGSGPVGAT